MLNSMSNLELILFLMVAGCRYWVPVAYSMLVRALTGKYPAVEMPEIEESSDDDDTTEAFQRQADMQVWDDLIGVPLDQPLNPKVKIE